MLHFTVAGSKVNSHPDWRGKNAVADRKRGPHVWRGRCCYWWEASVDSKTSASEESSTFCTVPGAAAETGGWPKLCCYTSLSHRQSIASISFFHAIFFPIPNYQPELSYDSLQSLLHEANHTFPNCCVHCVTGTLRGKCYPCSSAYMSSHIHDWLVYLWLTVERVWPSHPDSTAIPMGSMVVIITHDLLMNETCLSCILGLYCMLLTLIKW